MDTVQGIPFFPLEFDRQAQVDRPEQLDEVQRYLPDHSDVTDLFVFAHGWNNNMEEARTLYEGLLRQMNSADRNGRLAHSIVLAVFWPSKRFTDRTQIAGGSASLSDGRLLQALEAYESALFDDIEEFRNATSSDKKIDAARREIDDLSAKGSQRRFVDALVDHLPKGAEVPRDVDGSDTLRRQDGADLLDRLGRPAPPKPGGGGGAAAMGKADPTGEAAFFSGLFGGIRNAGENLLNVTTYYVMKERAGRVGAQGLNPVLAQIRQAHPQVRIHLVGHSFGGRLVTATGAASRIPVQSVALLQAAYSHYGLSHNYLGKGQDGLFRSLVTQGMDGPVVITHTRNDHAVGLAYALASRVSGVVAAAMGDRNDPFGGMGSNGAQDTPEAVDEILSAGKKDLSFEPNKVHNLQSDDVIKGHSEILVPEVGEVLIGAAFG